MNQINSAPELTICSVYHSGDTKKLLEFNLELTKRLNPKSRFHWFVADNTLFCHNKKPIASEEFRIFQGAAWPDHILKWLRPSYHHASALNLLLPQIRTRFVLILDNDFFFIKKHWIYEIVDYMISNDLDFFGAPYYPSRYTKYRYFPCGQCLFIDLERVSVKTLNFLPAYDFSKKKNFWARIDKKLGKLIENFSLRRRIGSSRDTGYRIFNQYFLSKKSNFESMQPVFNPGTDALAGSSWFNRKFEKFLPDKYCFIPKNKDYYQISGFKKSGCFDAKRYGWEEYFWRKRPFAIHLQNSRDRDTSSLEEAIILFKKELFKFK